MNILVLGSNCSGCSKTFENVKQVVEEHKIVAKVEKITDYEQIFKYGVMSLPALIVDGQVKSVGRPLDKKEILRLIMEN